MHKSQVNTNNIITNKRSYWTVGTKNKWNIRSLEMVRSTFNIRHYFLNFKFDKEDVHYSECSFMAYQFEPISFT